MPAVLTQDIAAGHLLKLKEQHNLTYAAIDEVVQLVHIISDHVVTKCLMAVWKSAESQCIDMNSGFIHSLPETLQSIKDPFHLLGTAYKQQAYIAKNFPYTCKGHLQAELCMLNVIVMFRGCGV